MSKELVNGRRGQLGSQNAELKTIAVMAYSTGRKSQLHACMHVLNSLFRFPVSVSFCPLSPSVFQSPNSMLSTPSCTTKDEIPRRTQKGAKVARPLFFFFFLLQLLLHSYKKSKRNVDNSLIYLQCNVSILRGFTRAGGPGLNHSTPTSQTPPSWRAPESNLLRLPLPLRSCSRPLQVWMKRPR